MVRAWPYILWLAIFYVPGMNAVAADFILTSPDIADGRAINHAHVYNGYGCQGENISPALNWQNEPSGTHSFAVVVHDPDAPRPGGWWHWLIFDIPRTVHALQRGAGNIDRPLLAPPGSVQSLTSFGPPGYGGPCPPEGHGVHRYVFTVYALDTADLSLGKTAPPADVVSTLKGHVLGAASITALYQR